MAWRVACSARSQANCLAARTDSGVLVVLFRDELACKL